MSRGWNDKTTDPDLVSVEIEDLEKFESMAQRSVAPLTESLTLRIDSNLHRVMQKLVSREDVPFVTTSDLVRYALAIVVYKLADLVKDNDIKFILGNSKLLMDKAMEERIMAQWGEIVGHIKSNLQTALADQDADSIYDILIDSIQLVEMLRSRPWRSRCNRMLAGQEAVQASIAWLWFQWGEHGEDRERVERARQLVEWLEGVSIP